MVDGFSELLDEFESQESLRYDGLTGVKSLEKIVNAIGYKDDGTAIETFLADNPGAIVSLVDWIALNGSDEWKNKLEAHVEGR